MGSVCRLCNSTPIQFEGLHGVWASATHWKAGIQQPLGSVSNNASRSSRKAEPKAEKETCRNTLTN